MFLSNCCNCNFRHSYFRNNIYISKSEKLTRINKCFLARKMSMTRKHLEILILICFEIQIYLYVSIHFMLCCSGRFGPKGRLCAVRERVCLYVHTER